MEGRMMKKKMIILRFISSSSSFFPSSHLPFFKGFFHIITVIKIQKNSTNPSFINIYYYSAVGFPLAFPRESAKIGAWPIVRPIGGGGQFRRQSNANAKNVSAKIAAASIQANASKPSIDAGVHSATPSNPRANWRNSTQPEEVGRRRTGGKWRRQQWRTAISAAEH
jgi:hypothetical protein